MHIKNPYDLIAIQRMGFIRDLPREIDRTIRTSVFFTFKGPLTFIALQVLILSLGFIQIDPTIIIDLATLSTLFGLIAIFIAFIGRMQLVHIRNEMHLLLIDGINLYHDKGKIQDRARSLVHLKARDFEIEKKKYGPDCRRAELILDDLNALYNRFSRWKFISTSIPLSQIILEAKEELEKEEEAADNKKESVAS